MKSKPLTLTTPPSFQCYDCQGCGACCRGRFAIIISRADRDRIAEQGWDAQELELGDRPLFLPRGKGFQLAHRQDGACIFLDANGRCRIHARFGEPAKPLPCRLYPFRFVPLGSQVRIDLRYDCPATAGNFGRPITDYRSALMGLMRQMVPEEVASLPVPPLYGRQQPTWAQLSRITETFERLLIDDSQILTYRVLNAVNLASLLASPRIVTLEGRKLSEFLETVSAKLISAQLDKPVRHLPPPGMVRMVFRQLLGLYCRIDQVGEKAHLLTRLQHSFRMLGGSGLIPPLRSEFPSVTFADIEQMAVAPTNSAVATLERYLHQRLVSMGFFGSSFYHRSYLDGLNALLLTYPLICWLARAFALGSGLTALDTTSVERAIQIIDHQHGITPLLDMPSERYRTHFLCDRVHLRSLVIWYGS